MLSMLLKVKSRVVCIIEGKEEYFKNGLDAYDKLKNKYSIISITSRNDDIIFELESIPKDSDSTWQVEYKQQFGKEPSFF